MKGSWHFTLTQAKLNGLPWPEDKTVWVFFLNCSKTGFRVAYNNKLHCFKWLRLSKFSLLFFPERKYSCVIASWIYPIFKLFARMLSNYNHRVKLLAEIFFLPTNTKILVCQRNIITHFVVSNQQHVVSEWIFNFFDQKALMFCSRYLFSNYYKCWFIFYMKIYICSES